MISSAIFGIENNGVLAITALITGVALVGLALWIAKLISPLNRTMGRVMKCA